MTKVFTREELALRFGVSAACINKWQASGKIHPIKVGGKVFYAEDGSPIKLTGKTPSISYILELKD